jgi:SAM-dependent methyltransferase
VPVLSALPHRPGSEGRKSGPTSSFPYDERFFRHVERSASSAAPEFLARVELGLRLGSLLDVGCGRGAWLQAWLDVGVPEVFGVDVPDLDPESLLIPRSAFAPHDIGLPFDLGRTFDLVVCLEVAEHLPPSRSQTLLENLARHGDHILFSAATPGQGGAHHVNERPLAHWADRFEALGFRCFDAIRPQLRQARRVEPWYRFNTLLFVRRGALLPDLEGLLATERMPGEPLRDFASTWWKSRNALLRLLPSTWIHRLACLKHRWHDS